MSQQSSQPSRHKNPSGLLLFFKQFQVLLVAGLVLATLFTAWTPVGVIADLLAGKVSNLEQPPIMFFGEEPEATAYPTPTPRPRPRLGIVAGHWGNDAGTVCQDGLTEAQVNLTVATLVKEKLSSNGFDVDLLKEFDFKLNGYHAMALVSIHADSCDYVNDQATGFKVAAALSTSNPEKAARLTACLRSRYTQITGLPYHSHSITPDMTSYHAFNEIHNETTAVIIETGFLNLDRQILTQYPETIAEGITKGITCYLYNEPVGDY